MESKTLLLVEDEATSAIVSRNELIAYGYYVLLARSGPQAIQIVLNEEKIDLILMDIELDDDMDGADTARLILDSVDIPVIFLSNHTESEYVDRTQSIRHYGYMVKPTAFTVLDMMIKNALIQHSTHHAPDGAIAFQSDSGKKQDALVDFTDTLSEFSDLYAYSSHGILCHDSVGRIIYANPAAMALIEALVDDKSTVRDLFDLEWLQYDDDCSESTAIEYPGLLALRNGRIITSARVGVYSAKMEKKIWLLVDAFPIVREEGDSLLDRVMVVFTDITNFRENEDKLRNRLEQKDRMIQEIHHRIKNNLYALGGIIDLRASEIEDEYARTVLMTTNSHLRRLKSLYELVYQSDISGIISGREYFSRLVDEIVETFPMEIETDLNIQDIDLHVSAAENLGVIINELLTNSVKFAFSIDSENRFRLEMRFDNNRVRIVASDNGPGFDSESMRPGLGTELIMASIANKNERYITRNHGGAVCEIEFDLE